MRFNLMYGDLVVQPNDDIIDFRGQAWRFDAVVEHGRKIQVRPVPERKDGFCRLFYPSVFKGYRVVTDGK